MFRGSRPHSRSTLSVVAICCFAVSAILALLDGEYWFALSASCFAGAVGMFLARAQEKGGIFSVLLWAFLVVGISSSLIRLIL